MAAILETVLKNGVCLQFFSCYLKKVEIWNLKFRDIEFSNDIMSHSIPVSMPISSKIFFFWGGGGGGL